jgi:hypothetical protein
MPMLGLGFDGLYFKEIVYKSLDLFVHIDLFYLGTYRIFSILLEFGVHD